MGRLDGLAATVVADDGPARDPWRGHRRCLAKMAEVTYWSGDRFVAYSHLVVIQDDAIPCPAFRCELECAIAAEPDATLVLFLAAQPKLTAMAATRAFKDGEPFAALHPRDWLPAVAVCYPAAHVADILNWADQDKGRASRSDDHMLGRWHRERKPRVLAMVPSLVDHPDDVPSVIGNGAGSHGRNPARVALFIAGP